MNFIIKSLLKKIFTQYLYMEEHDLDLASGVIKLPLGAVDRTRINQKLEPLGLRVTSSLYKNLLIHLPLVELMSKPIRVAIEVLDLVVQRIPPAHDHSSRMEDGKPKEERSPAKEDSKEDGKEERKAEEEQAERGEGGYFRNAINRLVYNMEVCMEQINIRVVDGQEAEEAQFTLESFKLKNSLVILEANLVKKTLTMGRLLLRHALGQLALHDLTLCLDFAHRRLHLIAVATAIHLTLSKIPYSLLIDALKRNPKKPPPPKPTQLEEVSVFLKVASVQVGFKLVEAVGTGIEIKGKSSAAGSELSVQLRELKCANVGKAEEGCLLAVSYLPFSKLVSINSEFEDSAIRTCWLTLRVDPGSPAALSAKLYHLAVAASLDQWKELADSLLPHHPEIEEARELLAMLQPAAQPAQQDPVSVCVDLLVYRACAKVTYGAVSAQVFGSAAVQAKGGEAQAKVHQLGVRTLGCNLLEACDLQARATAREVVLNGCRVTSQLAVSALHTAHSLLSALQRDAAYYHQKFKKYLPPHPHPHPQSEHHARKQDAFTRKVFMKFDEAVVSVGELIQAPARGETKKEEKFVSLVDGEVSRLLVSVGGGRVKASAEAIFFISSPYTLERTPLTNELQVEVAAGVGSDELSLSLKNKLVVLLQDHYINILYKLLDSQQLWCSLLNNTHQPAALLQTAHLPLLTNTQPTHPQLYKTEVEALSSRHVFWIGEGRLRVSLGGRVSQEVSVKAAAETVSKGSQEGVRELFLGEDKHYDYILKLDYNKLGNLTQLTLDYKVLITAHSNNYTFTIANASCTVPASQGEKWQWFARLEDLAEDYSHYEVESEGRLLRLEQLMAHEQFNILGVYQAFPQQPPLPPRKLYDSYVYQSRVGRQLRYWVMPLLIVTNNCHLDFQLEITDRKTQEREEVALGRGESLRLGHNGRFDYYLRQFTIRISAVLGGETRFESEWLYFNTFSMVEHRTETHVHLRSTRKNHYAKKALLLEETLLLKTKLITLRTALHLTNLTDFAFACQTREGAQVERVEVGAHSAAEWTHRIKEEAVVEFLINGSAQTRVEVRFGELREMRLLSFNFCKIQDRFFNVFVRAERRTLEGQDTLVLDHFIELINLCAHAHPVRLADFPPLPPGQRTNLALNSSSLSKYNNKPVELGDIGKIYAEVFLTAKVTDLAVGFVVGEARVALEALLKESSQEVRGPQGRLVLSLLKDMNNARITFYLTDRLYSQKHHYTLFTNHSPAHFLLADDSEYAPHFSNADHAQAPPEKLLIESQSFNCLLNRDNYDLLLCDRHQTHLEKVDKRTLDREGLTLQQYHFNAITLLECTPAAAQPVRKQLTTKEVEVRVRMYERVELSLSVRALTVRQLEAGKVDCLIQDIGVRNEDSKDHLLRVPEETYLLLEGHALPNGFLLLKNLFLKCKNVIVNIKRQMPYSLIELLTTLSERLGLNRQPDPPEPTDPRRYRENIKKLNGETKLRNHVREALLLIRNLYIHEIHLSLTIELESLSFSNVIILPFYELEGRFERQKAFLEGLTNFYLTALLAKFPKLSFLMSNFRSPLNTLRLFFNVREAFRVKVESEPIIHFAHPEFPSNPFHFSKQRWNLMLAEAGSGVEGLEGEVVCALFQGRKCLLVSSARVYWLEQEWASWGLRELQGARVSRRRGGSELVLQFRAGQVAVVEEHKRCLQLLNSIERLLL